MPVVISRDTAEYLTIIMGQVAFGNPVRRRLAAYELSRALGNTRLETSINCFENAAWDISQKKK